MAELFLHSPTFDGLKAIIPVSLRFRRSIRLLPGVHVNLGLHGAGLSVGPRGVHVGVNRRGMYTSAGIPGAGLYAVHHYRSHPLEHPQVTGDAGGFLLLLLVIVIFPGSDDDC